MMTRALSLLVCLLLLACDDDQPAGASSAQVGSWLCGKPLSEMEWLKDLVYHASTDAALTGDIYAGAVDGRVLFVHQPLIMSCLACVVYDCDGNRLDVSSLNHEEIRKIMDAQHKIFSAR